MNAKELMLRLAMIPEDTEVLMVDPNYEDASLDGCLYFEKEKQFWLCNRDMLGDDDEEWETDPKAGDMCQLPDTAKEVAEVAKKVLVQGKATAL